jgi:uncharacterized protein YxeA
MKLIISIIIASVLIISGGLFGYVSAQWDSKSPVISDTKCMYPSFFQTDCKQISTTDIDKENALHDWCYKYEGGYSGYTMKVECMNWILDQKLKPLEDKIDRLTDEVNQSKNKSMVNNHE